MEQAAATQLLSAERDGDIATVRRLLTEGRMDVNVTDEDDQSPLFISCLNGHLDIVKTLIEAGANINKATKKGGSSLGAASYKGHLNIVKTLIEAGANLDQADK
ncbi:hypothetical protein EMCRGX_G006253, partial [Ephydatia muelleri]